MTHLYATLHTLGVTLRERAAAARGQDREPVSYTHLTLPTSDLV